MLPEGKEFKQYEYLSGRLKDIVSAYLADVANGENALRVDLRGLAEMFAFQASYHRAHTW